jgi:hypothetical protein
VAETARWTTAGEGGNELVFLPPIKHRGLYSRPRWCGVGGGLLVGRQWLFSSRPACV